MERQRLPQWKRHVVSKPSAFQNSNNIHWPPHERVVVLQRQRGQFNLHNRAAPAVLFFPPGPWLSWALTRQSSPRLQESVSRMKFRVRFPVTSRADVSFPSFICLFFVVDHIVSSVTRASRGCALKLGDISEEPHEPWENLNSLNLASRLSL